MIRILLLALSVVSLGSTAEVGIDELLWQPELITKESILANYDSYILNKPPLFPDIPQLVFISDWSPRGCYFAQLNAKNIDYVSFSWFTVVPKLNWYGEMIDVEILEVNIDENKCFEHNQRYIQRLRRINPDIKIVPRFEFTDFSPHAVKMFVRSELLVQRAALTITSFCHEHGFDGAVIKCLTPLSDGIFYEDLIAGNDFDVVDLYGDMLETLEQVGNVIRTNGLISIFTMESPITLHNMEQEKKFFVLPPDFSHKMIEAYDFVHVWYNELELLNRQYIHDRLLEETMKFFNYSPKLLMGINFFGYEFPLDEYQKGGNGKKWTVVSYDRFLDVLKMDDAIFTFNEVNKEHELSSKMSNAFIIFPSLTQLEYRLAHIKQNPGVGIGIWEYGQGLDYFINLM